MKKNLSMRWAIPVWLTLGGLAAAQEPQPAPAAVQGIKGVKEDAVSTVEARGRLETPRPVGA